ncbi:MAG: hypothetical protein E2O82_03625 [Betaproteobacteria bacterium]|nr:MAG: hypothetical protein E2O82_03625 [Betaproteobacteria bacterium]
MKILMLMLLLVAEHAIGFTIDWPEDGRHRPELVACDDVKQVSYSGFTIKGCYDSNRIFILLNGTNAPCAFYKDAQLAAAKRGYLTICPERRNVGNGLAAQKAFEYLRGKGSKATTILLSGHSQGSHGSVVGAYRLQQAYPELTIDMLPIFPYFWDFYNRDRRGDFWDEHPKKTSELFPLVKGRKIILRGTRDPTADIDKVMRGYKHLSEPKHLFEANANHYEFDPHWENLLPLFD